MGEMASLWGYAENNEVDQLGQKLLCTTLELEKLKSETMEEMRKNKEYVKQLIHLLKCAIQERDEAKNQLGKLISKTQPITDSENIPAFPQFQPNSPLFKPRNPNSSIIESNSQSETYHYQSHGSSPVEPLFDAVASSPDFSISNFSPVIDQESLIIDRLMKGRVLPRKGMFLQAVLEAGPLLQTLLLAGPLPRWRNPPQLQPFQIPPVSIRGGDAEVLGRKTAPSVGQFGSETCVDFGNVVSGSCLDNGSLMSSVIGGNGCFRLAKRQRFCQG